MASLRSNLGCEPDPAYARRHDLDALRAFAMLLGIALHAALSFMEFPWVVQDRFRAPAFGYFVSAVHGFRMPLFFLLSGFFTAMLWKRRGIGGLLQHRTKRIALPLLLGCLTVVPAMWGVVRWAGSGNTTFGAAEVDTGTNLWTAAAYGDLEALRGHVESGAALDGEEPDFGHTALGAAVLGNQSAAVAYLLEAGADPSARYRDQNTAMHTAAFFGRADATALLLEAGADVGARNTHGETPLDSLRHNRGTTEFIAGLLQIPIDFDSVSAGRERIREMLVDRGAVSGLGATRKSADATENKTAVAPEGTEEGGLRGLILWLTYFPFFHHLWFLWFLCWLVAGYAIWVCVARLLPRIPIPSGLIATPLCLLWLVPLTILTQSFMHWRGAMPGFGPDTSAGLLPMPHVLAHYAIFFGFGALMFGVPGAAERLGRGWWVSLPMALLLAPVALALALQTPWGRELAGDEQSRRFLSNLGQVLYVWLMIFGLMGLFQAMLHRERPRVRFLSDASYWLYLVHLPLIIAGQALLAGVDLPVGVKFTLLVAGTVAILLVSYRYLVRYTWIGRLLNGPRVRPGVTEGSRPTPKAWAQTCSGTVQRP